MLQEKRELQYLVLQYSMFTMLFNMRYVIIYLTVGAVKFDLSEI